MNDSGLVHPPPAYSEREFSQKISHALELSSRSDQTESSQQAEWEEWSEAAFEAAVRARQATHDQSSSRESTTLSQSFVVGNGTCLFPDNTQPLRIQKHSKPDRKITHKFPPSWLKEAESDQSGGGAGSSTSIRPLLIANATPHDYSWRNPDTHHDAPSDNDEEARAVPPPPFAHPNDGLVRMTYELPQSPNSSPLTSPMASPRTSSQSDSTHHAHFLHHDTQPGNYSCSLRSPRQTHPSPPCSPNSAIYHSMQPPTSLPMQNPRKGIPGADNGASSSPLHQQRGRTIGQPEVSRIHDPSAFYNPAVSAHLTPMLMQPRRHADFIDRRLRNSQPAQPPHMTTSYAASTIDHSLVPTWTPSSTLSHGREITDASNFYPQHLSHSYSRPTHTAPVRRWATSEQEFTASFQ